MRKIITGILILLLSAVTSQAVYADAVGKFVKVEGRVDITRPGEPAELVNVGTEIFEKDIIRSKSDSKAEILFRDGNVLRLAQRTRVEVSEYISDSSKRSTILNLFRGKIQNKVKKLLGSIFGDDENRYEVHTPTSVCGVRGTDFFMTYEKGVSGATFKEGFGYGYNRNQPENMIEVQAGQSMVIPDSNAPPVLRTSSTAEINRLEGETTPAEEEGESIDEEDSSGQMDDGGDEGESVKEEEGAGDDEGIAEEGDTEEGDSESVGEETSDTADEGSSAGDEAEASEVSDSGTEMADSGTEQVESGSDSTDTGTAEGGSATGDSGFVSIDAGSSESGIDDGGIDGLDTGDAFIDTALADDQSENTDSNMEPTVPADQEDATLGSNDGPEILLQDAGDGDCPEGEDCDDAYSAIVDLLTTSQDSDSTTDPTPTDPVPTDPTPTDPTPTDPTPTDPIPTDPAPTVAISGKLMGITSGTHVEGEHVLPRSEDPFRTGYTGRIEGSIYEYDYFRANDGTYLRGFAEEEDSDTGTWTMYSYLPDGVLLTEIETDGDFMPVITESTWGQSDLASIATPPAGYYVRYMNEFAASMVTGIGSFTGEIQGISLELWSATQSVPLNISLSGQYTWSGDSLYLFKSPLSGSFTDGGTFSGFFSGKADDATGFLNALYINPEGTELGILMSDFTGTVDTAGGWSAAGTIYPSVYSTDPRTITNDNFLTSIGEGFLEVERLSGNFSAGSGETIKGHGFGNTLYISGSDWGIFEITFGYAKYDENAVSSAWSGSVSGFGEFGEGDGGIWFVDISNGEWSSNGISGDLINGRFLTMTKAGTIEGTLIGPAGTAGDWAAVSQGAWQKTDDLLFSSSLDGGLYLVRPQEGGRYYNAANASEYSYHYDLFSHEGGYQFYDSVNDTDKYMQINALDFDGTVADFHSQEWVYDHTSYAFISYSAGQGTEFPLQTLRDNPATYTGVTWDYHDQWTSYDMFHTGWFEGVLGGLGNPWTATSGAPAAITLLGFYEVPFYVNSGQPVIFANDVESYNPDNVTGAYSGYIGGVLTTSVSGNMYALYVDPANNAGILMGKLASGSADEVSGMWEADGGIYPVQLYSSIGVTPVSLIDSVVNTEYYFWGGGYTTPGDDGYFFDGSGIETGYFKTGGGNFFNKKIMGEPWGVWQNVLGGAYTGTPSFDWTMNIHHEMWDEFDNITGMIAKYGVSGGTWSGNEIDAEVMGVWVDLGDVVVGVSSGKLEGTYDPIEMTWQTIGSGVWLKAGQYIDMTSTTEGRATLAELNIPAVEIGRTTLNGTGSTMSITMTDVTFFASSTGGDARIWATDNISGTYTVDPYIGDYIYLSNGDSSITADFTLKKWDNNNWAADISHGIGTINRTDVSGTANVEFGGVAGGTYTGTASGSFSGEGAGVAR